MVAEKPAFEILVGNIGGATLDAGGSAALIKSNLEKALKDGIKIKVTPDIDQTALKNITPKVSNKSAVKSVSIDAEKAEKTISAMQLKLARFNEYLKTINPKGLSQFSGEITHIKNLLGSGDPLNAKKATSAIDRLKAEIKDAGYEGGNAITYLQAKVKTFATYLVSSTITMGFVNGIHTMIENVKNLDEALTDLRIVTGNTREETEALLKTYNQMAQKLGTTTVSVASGATDWLRQGYTGEEAEELLTQSMTLSIVGNMDAEEATTSLTAALKGLQLQTEDASAVVDKFFAVDMAAATSAENLALALSKTAANAKLAGMSLDDVIGQLAVVNEVMQEDGSSTGTFYNTMLARIGAIKSGRLSDPETGEDLSDVEATLRGLNIQLRTSDSEFRNFGAVLDEVGQKWNNFSTVQQRAIAAAFAGTRQQTRFVALMSNWKQAAEYASIASESAGKSAEKLAIYQESVEAKTAKATAAFENLSTTLLNSGIIGGIMDLGTGLFNALAAFDAWPAKIALIVTGITTLSAAIKSLKGVGFVQNLIKSVKDLGWLKTTSDIIVPSHSKEVA